MYDEKVLKRYWAKVERGNEDECWEWQGAQKSRGAKIRKGYGTLAIGSRDSRYAHRMSYEIHYGAIGDGLYVCHSCDNPPCVNPKHLFLGTCKDNAQDMVEKGRHLPSIEARTAETLRRNKAMEKDYLNGATVEEISKKYDVAVNTINGYLGPVMADVSQRQRAFRNRQIVADYRSGQYTMAQLAGRYAIDIAYVHRIIHWVLTDEEVKRIATQNKANAVLFARKVHLVGS